MEVEAVGVMPSQRIESRLAEIICVLTYITRANTSVGSGHFTYYQTIIKPIRTRVLIMLFFLTYYVKRNDASRLKGC